MTTVSTGAATDAQVRLAQGALRSQRLRLVDLFGELEDKDWSAPTRCPEWSVHDVVRHLCDVTVTWLGLLTGESPEHVGMEGFDPRTTPAAWVERSATRRPVDTLADFGRASGVLLDEVDRLVRRRAVDRVPLPYGAVPWSIVVLHVFWDAWVHERDIVLPLGRVHESPEIESRAAAAFGLIISGVAFRLLGTPLYETVVLEGDGGGVFRLDVRDETVTVSLDGEERGGDALRGALPDVVDSLIGRAPQLGEVLHGPADRVAPLGTLGRFMRTPDRHSASRSR
jgi:uncharacterized protein (TIGR03083 family)